MAIKSFRGMYGFLSNMHNCPVIYDGIEYTSSEAAFQAQKTKDIDERVKISSMSGSDSKRYIRTIPIREDWDDVRLSVMEDVCRAKFDQNPSLKEMLLYTDGQELIEGNTWGDRYWGVYRNDGENHLGKILMKLREEYLAAEQ